MTNVDTTGQQPHGKIAILRGAHMTYGTSLSGPIVPPARDGHRRKFSEADKRRIVEEAAQPGAKLSEEGRLPLAVERRAGLARRYGIAARVLFRWKQELAAAPAFVTVEITDANAAGSEERAP